MLGVSTPSSGGAVSPDPMRGQHVHQRKVHEVRPRAERTVKAQAAGEVYREGPSPEPMALHGVCGPPTHTVGHESSAPADSL